MPENQENTEKKEVEQQEKAVKEPEKESAPEFVKSESNQENWRKYREEQARLRKEASESAERERKAKEQAEALKAALEAMTNKPAAESYGYEEESEEDRIRKAVQKHLREVEEKRRKEEEQRHVQELPKKLKQAIPDFDKVCTEENIDYFEYHYPHLAIAYRHMPESYDKWSAVYQAIKQHVPYANKESDQKRIQQNQMKPQGHVPNVTDTSPQANTFVLTEERKRENYLRMMQERKKLG